MNKKNKIAVLSVCIILCLALAGGTFAWYLKEDVKRAQTDKDVEVMAPYNLYLLNPNDTDKLEFAVGNLHPGETKQTVIRVSNRRPDNYEDDESLMSELVKDSEFGYDLMLVHTDNLAVNYEIYPLTDLQQGEPAQPDAILMADENGNASGYYWLKAGTTSLKGADVSTKMLDGTPGMREKVFQKKDTTNTVNIGTYWLSNDDNMKLAYHNGSYEDNYYLIEISWKDGIDFDDYKKETDLVYVVVNAKQPRPVEEK